jgi:hypothetical protein
MSALAVGLLGLCALAPLNPHRRCVVPAPDRIAVVPAPHDAPEFVGPDGRQVAIEVCACHVLTAFVRARPEVWVEVPDPVVPNEHHEPENAQGVGVCSY